MSKTNSSLSPDKKYQQQLLLASIACLVSGIVFYVVQRNTGIFAAPLLPRLDAVTWFTLPVGLAANSSLPSLLHTIATCTAVLYISTPYTRPVAGRLAITTLVLLFVEYRFGTTNALDVAAILVGVALSLLVHLRFIFSNGRRSRRSSANIEALQTHAIELQGAFASRVSDAPSSSNTLNTPSTSCTSDTKRPALHFLAVISTFAVFAMGSYSGHGYYVNCARFDESNRCIEEFQNATPVYMSYQKLRSSVAVQPARPMDRIGRVYTYKQYIFVSERNEGIHVIDNSDAAVPENIGFIRIPGNTDINIRSDYLYADSYIDLVTLDLRDTNNIQEVSRQQDIFPYDARQNVRYNIRFSSHDRSRGVIVGYRN